MAKYTPEVVSKLSVAGFKKNTIITGAIALGIAFFQVRSVRPEYTGIALRIYNILCWHQIYCIVNKNNYRLQITPNEDIGDWSVETLGRECNSTGLCIHFDKTRVASAKHYWCMFLFNVDPNAVQCKLTKQEQRLETSQKSNMASGISSRAL